MSSSSKSLLALGFISVRHHAEYGYFGGYLIVNQLARPLEFHCTLPVKPSRAQSLLYGQTLDDFICGEQIAKALVAKAKLKPALLLTNCEAVLAFEHVSDEPMLYVSCEEDADDVPHLRKPMSSSVQLSDMKVGGSHFRITNTSRATEKLTEDIASRLAPNFDLHEPFQRIAEALLEAHPIVKAA
jgi:hypothetical protein